MLGLLVVIGNRICIDIVDIIYSLGLILDPILDLILRILFPFSIVTFIYKDVMLFIFEIHRNYMLYIVLEPCRKENMFFFFFLLET